MQHKILALSGLKLAADNVRRGGKNDLEELAASIQAHGLLENLLGVEAGGKVEIIAGGRRLRALQLLARRGDLPADHPVPVMIVPAEAAAREISLAENVQRLAMGVGEEAEAFAALIAGGADVAGVAHRFGVTELHVRQRLRLAKLAPVVMKALKSGKISLDVAKAFASVDDPERQARVYGECKFGGHYPDGPDRVRRGMAKAGYEPDHVIAVAAGRDAYLAAGGRIDQDLFGVGELWLDTALADDIARKALADYAEKIRAEYGFARVLMALKWADRHALTDELAGYEWGDPTELPADVRAQLVVLVEPGENGPGLDDQSWLHDASAPVPAAEAAEQDQPAELAPAEADELAEEPAEEDQPEPAFRMSSAMRDMLAMRARDALALALIDDPQRARDFALFCILEQAGDRWGSADATGAAAIHANARLLDEPVRADDQFWRGDALAQKLADGLGALDDSWRHLESVVDRWLAWIHLPGEERAAWGAIAVAQTLRAWADNSRQTRSPLLVALASSIGGIDARALGWQPTAQNYFDRVGKAGCLAFLADVFAGDVDLSAWKKWKKIELIGLCEELAAGDSSGLGGLGGFDRAVIEARGRRWLPPELVWPGAGTADLELAEAAE